MKGSLRRRLVVAACAWVLVLTAGGGLALDYAFRASVTRAFDVGLRDQLHAVIAGIETATDGTWWLSRRPADPDYEAIYSGRYWQIVDPSGATERSRSLWDESFAIAASTRTGTERFLMLKGPAGEPLRAVEQSVALPRLGRPLTVRVAQSREALDAEIARYSRLLVIALGVMATGLLIAVWLQVSYGLRPLRRMAMALRAVREGERDTLVGKHPVEVQPLVDELEAVLAHNRRLIDRARSSSADLAHALKTPLSVMTAELHAPGEDWRAVMARELDRTRQLVERHLGRAAMTGAGRGRRTVVGDVVADLVRAMTRVHGHRGIRFSVDIVAQSAFAGEREDLEEMLGNLLDNAGKWARSSVLVRACADEAGCLRVTVEDDGSGLPAELRHSAIERGRRFDEMTPGSGLGLAIVDDIATSYGGRLVLEDSMLGGLCAMLELPGTATV